MSQLKQFHDEMRADAAEMQHAPARCALPEAERWAAPHSRQAGRQAGVGNFAPVSFRSRGGGPSFGFEPGAP